MKLHKASENLKDVFKFDFRNRFTKLVGRDTELSTLTEFFLCDDNFSWWILNGKAGSGKSRLALEFGYTVEVFGAHWGFLHSDQIDLFNWRVDYHRPILIIIDYAQSESDKIGVLIKNLSTKINYRYKCRLLLIEREVEGLWWNNYLKDIFISNTLYKEEPFNVSGLDENILLGIVDDVIHNERKIITYNREELKNILFTLDQFQRPLFAMFTGLALAKGEHIKDWNQYNLLDYMIEDNFRLTKTVFKEHSDNIIYKHKNLLAIATVCYGLNEKDIQIIFEKKYNWLPTPDDFDSYLYSFMSDSSTVKYTGILQESEAEMGKRNVEIFPLLPDILGEYYVLKSLETDERYKYRDINKIQEFIELADIIHSYYYSAFLRRIIQDFPTHHKVVDLLIGNKKSVFDQRGQSGYYLIEAMRELYVGNLKLSEIAWKYAKILSETENDIKGQKMFMDDPDRVYQNATYIMLCSNIGDFDQQYKYYLILKDNTEQFERNIQPIGGIGIYPNEDDEPFDPIKEIAELEKMQADPEYAKRRIYNKLVIDARLPHLEILGIDCLLKNEKIGEIVDLVNVLTSRMFELCNNYTDPRMKKDTLISCIRYGCDKIPDFDEIADEMFDKILLTTLQVPPININMEKFLFCNSYIKYKYSIGRFDEVVRYFDRFVKHLISLNGSVNIGNIFIQLANLAKDFYKSSLSWYGNTFLDRISQLRFPFQRAPVNPIDEFYALAERYKNGKFD